MYEGSKNGAMKMPFHKFEKKDAVAKFLGLQSSGLCVKTVIKKFDEKKISVPAGTHTWDQFYELIPKGIFFLTSPRLKSGLLQQRPAKAGQTYNN